MIVSSFFSENMRGTIFFILSIVFEYFIFTVVVFSIFKTDEDIEQLINSLLISCVILCFLGLFEKISGYIFYSEFGVFDDQYSRALTHQMRSGGIRVKASFNHAIAYGAYIVTILPIFIYKYHKSFIKFNGYILLLMSAVIASQSRAGMIGAIIIFLLYTAFIERKTMILIFSF
jgi:hypothetical protein